MKRRQFLKGLSLAGLYSAINPLSVVEPFLYEPESLRIEDFVIITISLNDNSQWIPSERPIGFVSDTLTNKPILINSPEQLKEHFG